MGKFVIMKCPRCGQEFQQLSGIGFAGVVPLGGVESDTDCFPCPNCGYTFDPNKKGFGRNVIGEGLWD